MLILLNRFKHLIPISFLLVCLPGALLQAQSLKGSSAVMQRQNQIAVSYDYSFLKTSQDVRSFYQNGYLVKVSNSDTLTIHNVSYPYARAEVKLFLERLSRQYQNACGEKLVVTSLTRPLDEQPRNASDVSVHPTGMALDLRIPRKGRCRSWLQSTLLSLEKSNVLDVTRERYPPHFHVALFTETYREYVASLESKRQETVETPREIPGGYTVGRGDSLYLIAERYDTTVQELKEANNLRSNVLQIGQVLKLREETEMPAPVFVGPTTDQVAQVALASEQSPAEQETLPSLQDDIAQVAESLEQDYTVRRGDSLYLIAQRVDTTIEALRAANNLRGSVLQPGQVLTIPGSVETPLQAFVGPTKEQILAVVDQLEALKTPTRDVLVKSESRSQSSGQKYTVRSGDSLYLIAERNNTTIEALRAANNLSSIMLQPGQVLTIPEDAETLLAMTSAPELTHRVRRGDSLWEIATKYGTSISRLRAMNGLSGDTLRIGQVLKVSGN